MAKKKVHVSDHAVVRYFERILGFDMEEVHSWILGGLKRLPEGLNPISKGNIKSHNVLIKNNTAITVVPPGEHLNLD